MLTTLFANPVALTVLPPLVAGLLIGAISWVSDGQRLAMALAWAAGVLFIYWLLEGVPPLPPAAAKQKLGYLLGLAGLAGLLLTSLQLSAGVWRLTLAVLAALAVGWLGWSKFGDAENLWVILVAVAVAGLLAAGSMRAMPLAEGLRRGALAERPFLIPAVLMTTAIGGAVIAASGLFLGAAQILGALAAMLGGALAVSFLALLIRGVGLDLLRAGPLLTVAGAVLCVLPLTALLAPSASPWALLVLCLGPLLTALFAGQISAVLPTAAPLRPILAGAIVAVPAIVASLIAVLTGTSPFA